MSLNKSDLQKFHRNGYLILPSLLDAETCASMRTEIDQYEAEKIQIAASLPTHASLISHPEILHNARRKILLV